ncbi:MAG: peptidoglycan DD-metalloendopeptidase family protein [Oscillospiraceae bacterium]|jgi:murein DD-endopeptidase MepM/ murein hydrolase activator NlpD|nr:peptidoglycan DD-metalloendopeptidase family protein [Oscillospiraceae bacterium]
MLTTNVKFSSYFTAVNDAVLEVSDNRFKGSIINCANRVRNKVEDAVLIVRERLVPAFERRFVTAGLPAFRFASAAALCAVCLFAANINSAAFADSSLAEEYEIRGLEIPLADAQVILANGTDYGPVIVRPELVQELQTRLVTGTRAVAQPSIYEHEPLLEQGEGYVIEGTDGLELVTYSEIYVNGEWIGAEEVSATRIVEPGAKTVVLGVKGAQSTGIYIIPAEGVFYSHYGHRDGGMHRGLDISAPFGTTIIASDTGTVIEADWSGQYGNLVVIEHDNGDITYYGHMQKILCEVGDYVVQGEQIGEMGSTGNSTGPHVHFEYRPGGGAPVDPEDVLVAELPEAVIPDNALAS